MAQLIIAGLALLIVFGLTYILYMKRKSERSDMVGYGILSFDKLYNIMKFELAESTREDDIILTADINYEAVIRNKKRIAKAMTGCVYGKVPDRKTVISLIRDIVAREVRTEEDLERVVSFAYPSSLSPMIKFECLMYRLYKKHKKKVIQYLDSVYHISDNKPFFDNNGNTLGYKRCFDYNLVDTMYQQEILDVQELTYNEKLDIVAILLYQKYKGFGAIDTLRLMDIDGFHFGTSGSNRYELDGNFHMEFKNTNSVWVQIDAKWVHFSFIDFYTQGEMKRIVNQLVSWGSTAPMDERHPYKVSDMVDGSRVTGIRPPAGECWAVFVRKFVLSSHTVPGLLDKPYVTNWEIVDRLIYFLAKAECTIACTGQQNTGKTTLLKAVFGYVNRVNTRVLEMSFELGLRELYTDRDIFTVKPTDWVTSSQLQDLLKKTDAYLSMVGEVAEDIVAARMIQFCLVASAFTMFSHHGKDDNGLIHGLANSLVASKEYQDKETAMSTVLDAIKHNVHLGFVRGNLRVVEYISEIIKENEIQPYAPVTDNKDVVSAVNSLIALNAEHYTRKTDRVLFKSRKIIEFNEKTMTYEPREFYSAETTKYILDRLDTEDKKAFLQFVSENWGVEYVA